MKKTVFLSLCSFATLLAFQTINAAPITAGDLVIYRVGDGSGALGTTAASVFLDEYSPLGGLVQSFALPNAGGAGGLTAVGNASTEGDVSRSSDGSTLLFTGYQKAAGGTSPASDTYTTTARVVGTLNAAGTVDTTTTLTSDGGATTANTIRSATSQFGTAGSPLWTSTSSRVGYNSTGIGSLGGGTTQIDLRNSRQVELVNGSSGATLFAANGSTAITGKVQTYGVLPTGATAATPIVVTAIGDAVNSFWTFDLNPSVAGDDTLYALDTVASKLLKYYTTDGTTWTAAGSLTTSAVNLTGYLDGSGNVDLFLTSGTTLSAEVDSSGFGNTINGTISALTTASANTAFRGIGTFTTVVPEPTTLALAGLSGLCLMLFRRQRK